jgi:Lhr-like helicase
VGARLRDARRRCAEGLSRIHKVERGEDGRYRVRDAAIAKRHRMSIGTIVSDAAVNICYRNGKRLGNVEESFIARLSRATRSSSRGSCSNSCASRT